MKCSACKKGPIRGIVYKCKTCIGFYLCETCEEIIEHKHLLLKIRKTIEKDPLEELLTKICDKLSFHDKEKVMQAIIANNYDYDRTVESLLSQNN